MWSINRKMYQCPHPWKLQNQRMSNILGSTKTTSLPLSTAPSSSPKMNKPVYTRRAFATLIHYIIIFLSISNFFTFFYFLFRRVTNFIKGENLGSGWELRSIAWEALCILDLVCAMVALLSICITSGKAITTPQFLYRDRKKVLRVLIPLMISFVYLILTIYTHSLGPIDILMILVLVLALFGMLRPKKKDILSFCFVPFEEEESTDVLNAA